MLSENRILKFLSTEFCHSMLSRHLASDVHTPAVQGLVFSIHRYICQPLYFFRVKGKKDLYDVLGCSKTASDNDLKKAYKKLALALHPDKNCAPGAQEAFKGVPFKLTFYNLNN